MVGLSATSLDGAIPATRTLARTACQRRMVSAISRACDQQAAVVRPVVFRSLDRGVSRHALGCLLSRKDALCPEPHLSRQGVAGDACGLAASGAKDCPERVGQAVSISTH